ncbi:hypothetical protein RRG08_048349 [Elysia crispata]|uniref:Uncharacterized protein n=1 Tax=Elysia crispata TaxID=231223 RepID=A0AAE0YHJ9_9GAST|nr:hypothetical protein RRG08_048349 [Elysia crispata]
MAIKPLTIGGVTVLGVGCVLHIVGLATHAWLAADGGSLGFWEVCPDEGPCISFKEDGKPDWFKASEALALLGMIFGGMALLLAGVLVVMNLMGKEPSRGLGVSTLLLSVVSFVTVIICVIIFGAKYRDFFSEADFHFGYSFGLSIAGAALILLGGIGTSVSSLGLSSASRYERM